MDLKVGDKVRILDGRILPDVNNVGWGSTMAKYVGMETYITRDIRYCSVRLNIDQGSWCWDKAWLEKVED